MQVDVTQADREAYLAMNMLPEFDAADVRAGLWDKVTGLQAFARHRIQAVRDQADEIARLREERRRLVEALKVADDAIKEMFRYYDGGETRGSYDGKPERAQLRKAGYATRAMIAALQHKEPQP